jgi:hypothetical protein
MPFSLSSLPSCAARDDDLEVADVGVSKTSPHIGALILLIRVAARSAW